MAKKLIAVTNIKHDGNLFDAGAELDPKGFSREQLQALYDAGSVVVTDGADAVEPEQQEAEHAQETESSETPAE